MSSSAKASMLGRISWSEINDASQTMRSYLDPPVKVSSFLLLGDELWRRRGLRGVLISEVFGAKPSCHCVTSSLDREVMPNSRISVCS